jgi:hypothetical protein
MPTFPLNNEPGSGEIRQICLLPLSPLSAETLSGLYLLPRSFLLFFRPESFTKRYPNPSIVLLSNFPDIARFSQPVQDGVNGNQHAFLFRNAEPFNAHRYLDGKQRLFRRPDYGANGIRDSLHQSHRRGGIFGLIGQFTKDGNNALLLRNLEFKGVNPSQHF